ncbi:stAR-related lipid transfer protein 13-like isoform X3 [Myxocyprinus asiaticus]|uniref:stAR-related lipid transfer protein 13-like isoform X3 n=1 Tax=Myxocyprinus asiaticus TaxID=70543 RepID=UPI00222376AF|nr:stAR-related lipid transfer protein 13-like isoform X3 [Myxocyprinus asiaticus]
MDTMLTDVSDECMDSECLGSMTPETQDIYLRLDSHHRRSGIRLARIIARQQLLKNITQEIEAKEACDWLRAAGFPQYAQLYKDSQFPIEISAVKRDHDFLDKDLVEPLCRRLNTLNKCASMKLDVSLPKKKSEDSDEEDQLAISNRWTFELNSRRWSRLKDIDYLLGRTEERSPSEVGEGLRTTVSSESILTDLSEPEICSLHSEDSLAAMPDSASLTSLHLPRDLPHYGSLPAKNRRRRRTCAKDFLRRMETLGRAWGPSMGRSERRSLVISGPVLQGEPEALKTLRCVQIFNGGPLNTENMPPMNNCPNSFASSEASSQSETSGSAGSTPNMKGRVSKYQAPGKRAGIYLEDIDVLAGASQRRRPVEQRRKNEFRSYEELLVHIPKDHKPGTFPKALSIESLAPAGKDHGNWKALDSEQRSLKSRKVGGREIRPVTRCCPRGSRISVYDNVPGSHLYASTGDLLDLEKEDIFTHLDDILQHVNGLQQIVDQWSKNVLPESEREGDGIRGMGQRNIDRQSSSQITLDFEGTSVIEGLTMASDGNRDGISLNDTDTSSTRERRDSGVGASLTRPRLRWPSFRMSNRLGQSGISLQISSQSVGQLSLLQKFSLLRLTAIMEKYSMSNKHGWTWSVPKFMKRIKGPDFKDKTVFGVPLIVHVQQYGHPLPLSLELALRFLRSQCLDQVGLFRKSGVKSRIQTLRQMCETSPENVNFEDQSAYDVADMVKQFFRDLPEPLLTSKMGETFLHIYQYVPKEQRLQAVQAAIMLMADENREVLQTLLCFLNDVTSSVEENQMTPMNLAVCLAPSLFHLNIMKNDNLSPRSVQRKYATGRPDQKDLNENLAATQGLAHMIAECNHLFEIPQEMVSQSKNSYMEAELLAPSMDELCKKQLQQDEKEEEENSYRSYLESLIQNLLKETKEKTKGWVTRPDIDNTELSFKKVADGTPLRRWRVSAEVEAPPSVVLNRILRERHLWDNNLLQWKVLETLDKQTEVYQYVHNSMAPHPSRDFVVLRTWRTDMPKGVCVLISVSIDHEDSLQLGGVRGVVLESQYLLEPCGSGKSRLTHICRVDLKGKSPEWYNKAFGHLCATEAANIRNSFQALDSQGPETKI